jgi:hypothetical protein
MKTKIGRPPKAQKDKRDNILRVCLTESERRAIDRTAKAEGQDTSTWARDRLLAGAKD